MSTKQTLTVAEIKMFLLAHFNVRHAKNKKMEARLQYELGDEVQEEKPEAIVLKNKMRDWLCDLLAHRLERNLHTTTLLSLEDFEEFTPTMIDILMPAQGDKAEDVDQAKLRKFMAPTFQTVVEMVENAGPPNMNLYEAYWLWINTSLDLAAEREVPPTELFELEGATDEITRRMFSKEQFVALSRKAQSKYVNIDTLKKMFIEPLIDMLAGDDEEERRYMEQDLETKVMPQLRERMEKCKAFFSAYTNEETTRIYGTV